MTCRRRGIWHSIRGIVYLEWRCRRDHVCWRWYVGRSWVPGVTRARRGGSRLSVGERRGQRLGIGARNLVTRDTDHNPNKPRRELPMPGFCWVSASFTGFH
ncbi:hypothetical protein VTI74DRAFT_6949 [Chaetomium olivicolor]